MTAPLDHARIGPAEVPPPLAMLAELTHRCPLACPYCSNPIELATTQEELSTAEWIDIFGQAARLGVLHVHFSGGEPAARRDLVELTAAAARLSLYTNLITSGIGLTAERVEALAAAGLDHVQLSIQGSSAAQADHVSGYRGGFERKLAVAQWVRQTGLPLTVNAVCHKGNIDDLDDMVDLAVRLGARRLEVATVQFHGWAERNRAALMPTRAQNAEAGRKVAAARERLKGVLVIDYVPADHHATHPKPCMGGWARVGLNVTPTGKVLPCHAAETIPSLSFENVRDATLERIWYHGAAFNAFRGFEWMKEPCRSCDRRHVDFGGCRCQAMALAGDASAVDPACVRSPLNAALREVAETDGAAPIAEFVYRGR